MRQELTTRTEEETVAAGRELGRRAGPGTVVLLIGELGAGKTAFVRGLAEGLSVDPSEVSSPTFTLIQEYAGRLPLYHVDLYRIERGREVAELALDELTAAGVVAIEWAERLGESPPGAVVIKIEVLGETERRIGIDEAPTSSIPPGSSALPW
jgi:tRNA threonylcarbamoyladenosine biosynthesis protein TsaE